MLALLLWNIWDEGGRGEGGETQKATCVSAFQVGNLAEQE